MKIIEHFISLRDHYSLVKTNEDMPIRKKDLIKVLNCTDRNINHILKKLNEGHYLLWNPGRGRGKLSTLRFLKSMDEVATSYIHSLARDERYTYALEFIQTTSLSKTAKEKMLGVLRQEFGLKIEEKNEEMQSVIKIPIYTQLQSLDPVIINHKTEGHLTRQIFDTLLNYNHRLDEFEPNLAFTWRETNNGKTWTFYIRKDILFHNNRTLTTKDIQFTFQRVMDPSLKSMVHSMLEEIVEIEIHNDWIITFHLKKSNYFFLYHVSSLHCSILPVEFTSEDLIGTGPFFVKERKKDVLKLEAFPHYFKETALLDRIEIRIFPQQEQLMDYQLSHQTGKPKKVRNIQYGSRYVGFNFKKDGPHHDITFRKAMRLLMNQKQVVEDMQTVKTLPSNSFIYTHSLVEEFEKTSITEAKKLLEESPYNGETLNVYYFNMVEAHELAAWIKIQSNKIGLNLAFHSIPIHEIHDSSIVKNADILLMSVIFSDVEYSLYTSFKTEFGFLRPYLDGNQKKIIDDFLEHFHQAKDKETRRIVLQSIENYLKNNLYILFTYHVENEISYHEIIEGVALNSNGWADFKNMWIDPLKSTISP